MTEIYNKDYFENGIQAGVSGYENYRWLPERIYREIRAVIHLLGIEPDQSVLDFGCAKGYWVRGFREYGVKALGYDISEYAISQADSKVKEFVSLNMPTRKFDFIVSRNTLEHIDEPDLRKLLTMFTKLTDTLFFTVPLVDPRTKDYVMQVPDVTHKIRWTSAQWQYCAEQCGWSEVTSYPAVEGLHDNFKNYPRAMGFYVAKK
jgi:cyclopropane fatty-acyl-phospholipid synthase-like methyltransferase